MTQIERDKIAILRVLADGKEKSYSQILLQAGEGLYDALIQLIDDETIQLTPSNNYIINRNVEPR